MADTTATSYVMDPFYALSSSVESTKTKVADSIFENYKLAVAQTNDINNRAMQVALSNSSGLAALKAAVSKDTLENMLAASRTAGAVAGTAMIVQRNVMEQGEATRGLINGINTQNLNTALINSNTAIVGGSIGYGNLGSAYGGLNAAVQSADITSAINAFGSQITQQRVVNTGNMTGTVQTSTSTNIGP